MTNYADEFEFDYYEPAELVELLAEGEGRFRITEVVPGVSKAGNKMLKLSMDVTDARGVRLPCYEYLVQGNDEAGKKRLATKIKNISNSIGKPQLYAKGYKLKPNDLLGEGGKCVIKTQEGQGNYPQKSVVSKYIPITPGGVVDQATAPDDDLPF